MGLRLVKASINLQRVSLYIATNGDIYAGTYLNGVIEGDGTAHYANGNSYLGKFKNGYSVSSLH